MLYSKRFYADKATFIVSDLGIKEKYKPIIEKRINFFGEQKRTQRFYDFEIDHYREDILKYLSDRSIKQVDLMRKYNISRNTLKKYISLL